MKYLLSILVLFSGLSFSDLESVVQNNCMNLINEDMRIKCIAKSVGTETTKTQWQIWEEELSGYVFKNLSNFLVLKDDRSLEGKLKTTKKDSGGTFLWTDGIWEIFAAEPNYVIIMIYSENMNCKYKIEKKSKKYFFTNIGSNFANICPDTLLNKEKFVDPFVR